MTLSPTSRVFSKTSPSRLGTYLATAVGSCGLATSADADIVIIDVTNVSGVNGGLAAGGRAILNDWVLQGDLIVYNNYNESGSIYQGLRGNGSSMPFAIDGGVASPTNFSYGSSIGASTVFSSHPDFSLFSYTPSGSAAIVSPNFGANSYLGFKTTDTSSNTNYGWIEVTWDGTDFQILSAAYESTPGTPILAGATTAVPEPSTGALAALVLGGTALGVARRRRKKIAPATTEPAV